MLGKLRIVSIFVVATLIVVAGCSILAKANGPTYNVRLRARHQDLVCYDIGTIVVDAVPHPVPSTFAVASGVDHPIDFVAPAGCDFVMWEVEGGVFIRGAVGAPKAAMYVTGDGTLRVVFRGICCRSVGGVVPANPYMILTPYLAMVGLVATTAAVIVKKRRN